MSLRDVVRAMIVFKYFVEKMSIFSPHMNKWARGEFRHVDNEFEEMVCSLKDIVCLFVFMKLRLKILG